MCMKQALSPARPAQVPGATSSVVRLPGSQQPTHGFAALWLRPASGPAQAPAHLRACQPLGPQLPAHQQAQPSMPRSGLSNVSETGQRPVSRVSNWSQAMPASDVPQPQSGCPSSSAQAGQALTSCSRLAPSHPAGGAV